MMRALSLIALSGSLALGLALALPACGGEEQTGTCDSPCISRNQCPLGQTCQDGCCAVFDGCDPAQADSCQAGQFCNELYECEDCGINAVSCMVVGASGQLPAGVSQPARVTMTSGGNLPLAAVALGNDAFPIYCAQFDYSATGGTVASGVFTAGAPGSATVTAEVAGSGGSVSCELEVTILAAPTGVRVWVYDERLGTGVAGASVVVDPETAGAVLTDASGVATITPAGPFMVSAFKASYTYATVVGLSPATHTDIALPIAYRPAAAVQVGGFHGVVDRAFYQQEYQGGREQTLHAGFVGGSIPLSALLTLDTRVLFGSLADGCTDTPRPAGCYPIQIGTGSASLDTVAPLPGGLFLGTKTAAIKEYYDAQAVPGRRLGWTIGGEADVLAISSLFPLFMSDAGFEPALIFTSAVPLLTRFASGISGDLDLTAAPQTEWDAWRVTNPPRPADARFPQLTGAKQLALREGLRLYTELTVNSLPADPWIAGSNMDAVVVAYAVNAAGYGLVPLGIAAGMDLRSPGQDLNNNLVEDANETWTPDGKPDATRVCTVDSENPENSTCPFGVTGNVADGKVALFHAPAHSGLQGATPLQVVVALPLGGLADGDTDFDYGPVRVTGTVLRQAPAAGVTLGAADFLGFSSTDGFNQPARTLTVGAIPGANAHLLVISEEVAGTGSSVRWAVYVPGSAVGSITLPPVPAGGLPDPVDQAQEVGLVHLGVTMSGATFDGLLANNGRNLDQMADAIADFSLRMDMYPAQ